MAIKKKTKAQKDQDKKDLERAQNKLVKAVKNFERSMWDCEFDVEWIRIKDVNDMFYAANGVEHAKTKLKETHVYDDYEDIKDKDHSHMTHKRHYED